MTANVALFTFASPTDLILEIPANVQNQAYLHSQSFSHPSSGYQAYLNELCLNVVLPWLQADFAPQAKVSPNINALASFWELVNGTAIVSDGIRFILVPSEAMDLSELRVPQEWVDISSFAGDYYLAVQVEPDEAYVRVWGYCSYEQLKNQGNYDASDRTYSLDATDIITDINVLTVARQLCLQESTQNIAQLPTLPQEQAQNLISRLANPEIITPRLAIPFQLWGALIEHGGWRQSLYQRRLGLPEQWSVVQWLQSGVSQLAENIGWGSLNLQLLSAASARSVEEAQPQTILSRQLAIAGQIYELRIIPQTEGESTIWRFELRNAAVGAAIPGGFKLRLLTEDLQSFPNNEDIAITAVEQLFVEVALEPGEGIVWEIEPKSENYDREILRF